MGALEPVGEEVAFSFRKVVVGLGEAEVVEERALVDLPAGETLPAILGGDVTDERAAGQGVHEAHRVLQLLETKAAQ